MDQETDDKAKAEARTARLLALIFGGLIVALIAIMMAIDIYADQRAGHPQDPPHDSADH